MMDALNTGFAPATASLDALSAPQGFQPQQAPAQGFQPAQPQGFQPQQVPQEQPTQTVQANPAPAQSELVAEFNVEGLAQPRSINLDSIPQGARVKLLHSAARAYITNRLSSAASKVKKANAAWESYDLACKQDPLQNAVARPDKPKETLNTDEIVDAAIKAMYDGNIATRAKSDPDAPKKEKANKDPVVAAITRTVVNEVFAKNHALNNQYKYPTAQKEVGQDGLAYLKAKAQAAIAAGQMTEQVAVEFINTKYVRPARIMLGLEQPEGTANVSLV